MPHASLRLVPGVNRNLTPAYNEAGISNSQLVRFIPDPKVGALPQTLGGWTKFYLAQISSTVWNLWPWADADAQRHLAVGAQTSLGAITSGSLVNITPQTATDNVAVSVTTVAGSSVVTIADTGSNATAYDSVFVQTPIAVGGLVLSGVYPCILDDSDHFQIVALDVLGNPRPAVSSVTSGGAVPQYTTTSGSAAVLVTLAAHGYSVGDTYAALVSTTFNGVTISGAYEVAAVSSSSQFTIEASTAASASSSASVNGGNARYLFFLGSGPLPAGSGYGVGGYGVGGYGAGVAPTHRSGATITASDWSLDNWGGFLVACPQNGPIYVWDPLAGQALASVIPQAPPVNAGAFVAMPERQIMAWGSTVNGVQDPLLIRWCDIEDFSAWIGLSSNQAGQFRLSRGSTIVRVFQAPQQILAWTDLDVWAIQYINQPSIYGFNIIGTGCGLIAPKAVGVLGGATYWMSQSQFFVLSGNGPVPVPCPVWDVIFPNIDTANLASIRCAPNSRFNEISWFYPVVGSGGVATNYVKMTALPTGPVWDFGVLERTAWTDQSVFGPPIGASPDGYLYQHETSAMADGGPMLTSFSTGYFALNEADMKAFVDEVWPDMKWGYFAGSQTASVQITFSVADFPSQTPVVYGPYDLSAASTYITPRLRGRLMSITIASGPTNTAFWRLGNIRYRVMPDGKY